MTRKEFLIYSQQKGKAHLCSFMRTDRANPQQKEASTLLLKDSASRVYKSMSTNVISHLVFQFPHPPSFPSLLIFTSMIEPYRT